VYRRKVSGPSPSSQVIEIPAVCPNGHAFPSGIAIGVTPSVDTEPDEGRRAVTLGGNRSQCPRCGEMADVIEGSFTLATLRALFGVPRDELGRLRDAIDTARREGYEEGVRAAQRLSPHVQDIAAKSIRSGPTAMWFIALAVSAIMWLFPATGAEAGHDLNHFAREVVTQMYVDTDF
jgi:hypothetical protein